MRLLLRPRLTMGERPRKPAWSGRKSRLRGG